MKHYILELVDRRWDALLSGEKLDTLRWNEGDVQAPCFITYKNCSFPDKTAVVYAYSSSYMPLREVPDEPDKDELLTSMRRHYPTITLDTEILYVEHLSVAETAEKYPNEVKQLLEE